MDSFSKKASARLMCGIPAAGNEGPKGRQFLAGGERTREPPESDPRVCEPRGGDRGLAQWSGSLSPLRGSDFRGSVTGGSLRSPPAKDCRPLGPSFSATGATDMSRTCVPLDRDVNDVYDAIPSRRASLTVRRPAATENRPHPAEAACPEFLAVMFPQPRG